jgi:hydroxymethylpyrimidine/phosphomethylpyrimidine kinase
MSKKLPNVMTFSATDATSGAGLQADVLTIASLRCNPLSIVTGVSVQDTLGVRGLTAINAELVNDQTRTILGDMEISAFKCGLLGSVENIRIIAEILEDYPEIPLIIDPVLASGRGDDLVNAEIMKAMLELLFPKSYLITPNSHEARRMVIEGNENFEDLSIDLCAERLKLLGCKNILITGADENTEKVINILYEKSGTVNPFHWDRLPETYHGSGCTLASAVSAYLALGVNLKTAVEEAQIYTWESLKNASKPGKGQYIPERLYEMMEEKGNARSSNN